MAEGDVQERAHLRRHVSRARIDPPTHRRLVAGAAGVSRVAEFVKGQPAVELALGHVAMASIVPAIAAALFAMVLNAVTKSPARIFLGVSLAFGLFSLGGPLALSGASLGLKAMLELMHVVAGVTIAGGILRYGRR